MSGSSTMAGRHGFFSGRWARMLLWAAVALVALAGLGRALDPVEVLSAVRSADSRWLLLAAATIGVTQALKALRWRALLKSHGIETSLRELVRVQLIGQGLNTFLPVRVGEVARVQWMGRHDRALVLSTVTIEKSADLLCFGVMGLALAVGTTLPAWLSDPLRAFALTTAIAFVLLCALLALSRDPWLAALSERFTKLGPPLGLYRRFRRGWGHVARPKDAVVLGGLSAFVWGMAVATNVCLFAALGAPTSWVAGTVLLVVLQAGITIVTLPATIGIFEYLCVLTLGWFGVPEAVAFSVGIVLHLLVLVPSAAGVWFSRPRAALI